MNFNGTNNKVSKVDMCYNKFQLNFKHQKGILKSLKIINIIIKFHQLEVHKPKSIIINYKLVYFNSNNVRFNFYY